MKIGNHIRINSFTIIMTMVALLSAMALGVVLSKPAHAMGLKQNAVVDDNMITVGDIFYDVPHQEDRILGAAPRPGQDMVLNARTLMRIAVALDLPWRPASSADHVVLKRAATVINDGMLERGLHDAMLERGGLPAKFEIDLPPQTGQIVLPPHSAAIFEITDLDIDLERSWFEASIAAPSADNPIQRLQVNGHIHQLTDVPVLRRAMKNGDIIRARDLDSVEMRSARINHGVVLSAADLIGMTPRRMILDGQPVSDKDIQAPRIVGRGETVTLVFQSGPLFLSAQGKALESGSKGDLIRVVNASSSRAVEGVITAEREVTVQSF